jgi:hypothetical protein
VKLGPTQTKTAGRRRWRALLPLATAGLLLIACSSSPTDEASKKAPTMSEEASNLTVYRARASRDGLFGMVVFVNNVPVKDLAEGQQHSFSLEPGTYVLGYILGLSECEETVKIAPRRNYLFRLAPGCDIAQQQGG